RRTLLTIFALNAIQFHTF
ncbi:hypothetical protein D039_0353B, partial [Vibrio parahaemolyticus EKP-028]